MKKTKEKNMSKNFEELKNKVYEEAVKTRTAISKQGISELASKEYLSSKVKSHIGYVFNGLAHTKEYAGKRLTVEQEQKLRSYNPQLSEFLNLLSELQRYHFGRHKKEEPEAKEALYEFLDKHEHEIYKEKPKEDKKEE